MAGKEILGKKTDTLGEYINHYFRDNGDIMGGIREGLADIKAGRVRPWSEIKKELNL